MEAKPKTLKEKYNYRECKDREKNLSDCPVCQSVQPKTIVTTEENGNKKTGYEFYCHIMGYKKEDQVAPGYKCDRFKKSRL